jgi:hypothetical protein
MIFVGLMTLPLAPIAFSQTPPPPPPEGGTAATIKSSDLDREQRQIAALLEDTTAQLREGLLRIGENRLDSATATGMRAIRSLFASAKLIDVQPQRIEMVQRFLFSESAREEYRAKYRDELRPKYFEVEKKVEDFAANLQGHGYSAVMVALGKVRTWMNTNDAAARKMAEDQLNQVVTTFSDEHHSNDDRSNQAVLNSVGGGGGAAGAQVNVPGVGAVTIKSARDNGNGTVTLASGESLNTAGAQALGGGNTLFTSSSGATVVGQDGTPVTIAGATVLPDGKLRLRDGSVVDLKGCTVQPDGSIKLADGSVIRPDGTRVGGTAPGGKEAKYVNADGSEIVIPPDFDWKNGEAKGIEKTYVGGKGARLIRETKVTFRPTPSPSAPNTFVVSRVDGESRTWAFEVAPVPGSEKKSAGNLSLTLALSDRSGGTGFTVSKWNITSPSGSPTLSSTSGAQVSATFTASATYTIEVSGTTDWDSSFVIKANLPVGVD